MKISEILETCNYQITYNWNTKSGCGEIYVSWLNELFIIKWNKSLGALVSNYKDQSWVCCEESAKSLAHLALRKICADHNFSIKFVTFTVDDQKSDKFVFNDTNASDNLFFLSEEIYYNGLRPEHVELCKKDKLWSGLKDVTKFYLGLDLKDDLCSTK